jgi:hypothetical protein
MTQFRAQQLQRAAVNLRHGSKRQTAAAKLARHADTAQPQLGELIEQFTNEPVNHSKIKSESSDDAIQGSTTSARGGDHV